MIISARDAKKCLEKDILANNLDDNLEVAISSEQMMLSIACSAKRIADVLDDALTVFDGSTVTGLAELVGLIAHAK